MKRIGTRRFTSWSMAIIIAAMVTACTAIEGFPPNPEDSATLDALRAKYFGPHSEDSYDVSPPSIKQTIRDDIVYGRMHVYDLEFSQFQRALYGNGNIMTVGGDLTALVLNGIGATTGGAGTKAAMNAASGGIIGAQGDINKDLFYNKALPAVISQMEANREKVKLAIITGLKQSDTVYSLKRANLDLAVLNDAGSLPNAISNITQQSTDSKNAIQAQIQALQSLTYTNTDAAVKLRAWLYVNGKVDQTHYNALQTWLNNQPEAFLKSRGYPPAAFVTGDDPNHDLEPIRQRALNDPTLNISK
jgi:hypothetical protein